MPDIARIEDDKLDSLVARVREALQGVTKGPWHVGADADAGIGRGIFVAGGGFARMYMVGPPGETMANARFTAAARDLVPELADELTAIRTALDAALADARREGKLEGLREAQEACRKQQTTSASGARKTDFESGNDSAVVDCIEAILALAARVEGGDA